MNRSNAWACCIRSISDDAKPIPLGKRVPFSAAYISVPSDNSAVRLYFVDEHREQRLGPCSLRIVFALDVRENRKIEVCINGDLTPIGVFDIRFAYALQPFDIRLTEEVAHTALTHGLSLRMLEGREDTFLFAEYGDDFLCPRLLFDKEFGERGTEFYNRLYSIASIQPFGWMEGCVLDGLSTCSDRGDKNALATIGLHLGKYIHGDKLVYEGPRSNICDGSIYGIEGVLPFAIMEKTGFGREAIQSFHRFLSLFDSNEIISDSEFISAEGSYTIAYPLATIAASLQDSSLAEIAIQQLLKRKQLLCVQDDLYLRYGKEGQRTFKNWGRAYVWYLLGLTQTLKVLDEKGLPYPEELQRELLRVAEIAAKNLGDDGMCHVFLGEGDTGIETSGSAGIAAAFSLGYRAGLLDRSYELLAHKTREALSFWLTPDGMLYGVAQSNKDGERLQRSGYRVISQMAMGLMAHI